MQSLRPLGALGPAFPCGNAAAPVGPAATAAAEWYRTALPTVRPPAETPHLEQGRRYELLRKLSQGGMGELHLARVTGLHGFEQAVVVKRVLPHLAEDPQFVEMLFNEARLAARLDHPNIVKVFDVGVIEGRPFFAMEYVPGCSLDKLLRAIAERGEVLPLAHALTIGIGIGAGLHHAHEACDLTGRPLSIVHRDVSPSNVLVSAEGAVKLTDFGVAKALASTQLTREGVRKGKVSYMSPEQCIGEAVDRRADVFALGVVLYELSTMRRLFVGDNEFAIMNRITEGRIVPPSAVVADYPPALERVILRTLAVAPDERPATAWQVLRDLESVAAELGIVTSPYALGEYLHRVIGRGELPSISDVNARTAIASTTESQPVSARTPQRAGPLFVAAVCAALGAGYFGFRAWGSAGEGLEEVAPLAGPASAPGTAASVSPAAVPAPRPSAAASVGTGARSRVETSAPASAASAPGPTPSGGVSPTPRRGPAPSRNIPRPPPRGSLDALLPGQ